jgi:succinate-semialdehyde dehydrogenase/glutarate-semialdehyde dehydrogenase
MTSFGSTIISTNPGKNYEVLGEVTVSSEKDIVKKVNKARQAVKGWTNLGIEGRVKHLRGVFDAIKEGSDEIAHLITQEMGMPISSSLFEVGSALDYFNWYLENAAKYLAPEVSYEDDASMHKVFYEPIGVVAVITPWNFPLSNFVWGVTQNLVVGNTVVFKHSEEIPLFGKLIEKIVTDCKLPEGVFSEVYGNGKVGDLLVHQDINLIWFTGSTKVGKNLYKVAAEKFIRVVLELGGSAPGILFEDVDIEAVIGSIYNGKFTNCGQVCDGLKRMIVHESRFDETIEKLKKLLESKRVGDPEDEKTDFGPLVAQRQLELLEAQVKDAVDKGTKIITGGKEPKGLKGAYYEPTLLTNVTKDMRVWNEEVFGPVLPVVSFKTEEEAIELANDTRYGLGSYIYCEDKDRVARVAARVEAGMVSVNNAFYLMPASPFGGYKESGFGREHGKYGLRELTQVKVVAFEK